MTQSRPYARSSVLLSTFGLLAAAACGDDVGEGSRLGQYTGGNNGVDSGSSGIGGGGAVFGMSSGGEFGDDELCDGIAVDAEPLPVDMYVMLDQSSSMAELLPGGTDKWTGVVSALQAFVSNPQATGIGVGIQYFGLPDPNECNAAAYAAPEVPIGLLPGVAQQIIDSTNAHGPTTLTPTFPALKGALDHMVPVAQANAGNRAAIVVLATDGFPTRCSADGRPETGASIQDLETLARQYAELDPPVRTYVVGVGEALANLRSIAEGGGTGQPFLIESGDIQTQFLNAMLSIASTPLQCEFPVPESSDAETVVDIRKVQVLYTAAATREQEQIPKVNQPSDCTINRGEGWYYDHPDMPTKIQICPGTCKRFSAGSVAINIGCTPVSGIPQ